jgi:protein-disulfide isomerase
MKTISRSILITLSMVLLSACSSGGTNAPTATLGNAGAPVVIQEFSDFQCPACGMVSPQVEEVARANLDKVRLEFHHFPLSQHENAFRAAVAAECANLQGKFWEYGKLAFQNQTSLTDDKLKEMAQTIGLDTASFNACLDGNETSGRVRDDMRLGADFGVSYTPSLYVNGKLIQFSDKQTFEGYLKTLK